MSAAERDSQDEETERKSGWGRSSVGGDRLSTGCHLSREVSTGGPSPEDSQREGQVEGSCI